MTSKNQNFEIYAGDTKNVVVTVTDNNGNIVNLSGSTIKWKLTLVSGTISKDSTTGGITITNPEAGIFTIKLVAADTTGKQGGFNHGAEVIDGAGNVSTVLVGLAIINPAII